MLATLLAALCLAAPAPPPERVVEEIVAIVRNPASAPPRIVTLTKLTEEARIALVSRGATEAASGPLDRAALGAALEWLLDQMLVADDAARLRIDDVPRAEILAELRRFRAQFGSAAEYHRFLRTTELTEEELLVTLARTVRVQRYLESRVGRAARVDDREVDRLLAERGAGAGSGAARDAARAELAGERAAREVRELVAELRARADVRILAPPGARGER